ncbi:MAG: M28 family peptidase [Deltaproteobacteria bacterium]|nr:M28 family peptidase [Deltaproteobacteria bacterium]
MTFEWIKASPAAEVMAAVDADRMWRMLEYFSTLKRDSGKPDEHKACRYIVQNLSDAGVPHDLFEFDAYLSHPLSAGLKVYHPRWRQFKAITHSFSGNTPPAGVAGEVVFIGAPEFYPGMAMDTSLFENVDLRGKIVLAEGLVRPWKTRIAQQKGALALINANVTDQLHNMIVSTAWGMPASDELHLVPDIPVISIDRNDGKVLIEMCRQGPVEAVVQTQTEKGFFPLLLPVAKIGGQSSEDFILIHGHIDSWHVGITDNATGNATKLELARLFHRHRHQLKRGIIFAWWPGHSTGRYAGSTWYSDQFWQIIYEHAVVDINVDSTGVRGAFEISPKQTYELEPFIQSVVSHFIKQDSLSQNCRLGSLSRQGRHADQSFWANCGSNIRLDSMIPEGHPDRVKVGGSGGGWWWHTEHDTLDKADPDILKRDTRLLAAVAAGLANATVLPMDHRRVASRLLKRLEQLKQSCKGAYDFSGSISAANELAADCMKLFDRAQKAKSSNNPQEHAMVNRVMMKLNRILTPALLTDRPNHRHQPAQPGPDLPGLSPATRLAALNPESDQARFLKCQLKREENRLISAVAQARELIAAVL